MKVHFSGIGGTGMVGAAALAIEAGWTVRGSDNPLYPPTSRLVASLNVPVAVGYNASNLAWNPDMVVIGNALSRGNPEVEEALSRRFRYMSMPEWMREHVLRDRRPVVVAGTHGKTTTTTLTAALLDAGGMNPGYLIGGEPLGFPFPSKLGSVDSLFVIEGDEYDTAFFDKRAKFLHYLPQFLIVTSLEFDHGDIYRDVGEIETAFQHLLRLQPREGCLYLCADNHARSLRSHAFSKVATYGFSEDADWRGTIETDNNGTIFLTIFYRGIHVLRTIPPLAGRHNLQNILAATALACDMDVSAPIIAKAIAEFQGVRRRMEVFHEARGITWVDDFAHHPTAIRETIAAAKMKWPGRRVIAAFEPRSNTSVTRRFQREITDAFQCADGVFLGPVYRAERIPAEERLDRQDIVDGLQKRGVYAMYADDYQTLLTAILKYASPTDIVLMMSNGAFGGLYDRVRNDIMG